MSRTEENNAIVELITKAATTLDGSYENMVVFQLGSIAAMLGDISKSMAIVSDKIGGETD